MVPKAACDVQFCAAETELPPKWMIYQPGRRGARVLNSFCNVSTPGGRARLAAETRSREADADK